ncbi:MAG: AAA family ATPase [Victivallaceae bacterium]
MIDALRQNLRSVIRGKDEAIELLLTALLAGGHVLLDDVPGVGKTTLAKALARSLEMEFRRVQFTPDLLPADIAGSSVFDPSRSVFEFRPGPVFTNILLADEINRASPRTQSALLEAMSERQVSCDGATHRLPEIFFVIATQNPIEFQGTYPLPESELDRFAMRLSLGYPDEASELSLLLDREKTDPLEAIRPVMTAADLESLRAKLRLIGLEQSVAEYLTKVIRATREDARIALGCSPRAMLALADAARAAAMLEERDFVMPDDIKRLAPAILSHRMILHSERCTAGSTSTEILEEILRKVKMPV